MLLAVQLYHALAPGMEGAQARGWARSTSELRPSSWFDGNHLGPLPSVSYGEQSEYPPKPHSPTRQLTSFRSSDLDEVRLTLCFPALEVVLPSAALQAAAPAFSCISDQTCRCLQIRAIHPLVGPASLSLPAREQSSIHIPVQVGQRLTPEALWLPALQ